jgi:hypothetical protein
MQLIRKYLNADTGEESGYGFGDDSQRTSPFNFGGNFGVTFLKKFEYIPNGGKDGAEQDALDIIFEINKVNKNYRMFPVSKVYNDKNQEITDKSSQEYKDAFRTAQADFNAVVTHILHAFIDADTLKASLSRPFKSFKDFAQFASTLLPKNFSEIPLDIFLQYQWQISPNQTRTYLDIPKKMKYGVWLKPSSEYPGTWTENRAESITEQTKKAIWYTNEKGEEHAFQKNGWFMLSNFANVQKVEGGDSSQGAAAMNSGANVSGNAGGTPPAAPTAAASAW